MKLLRPWIRVQSARRKFIKVRKGKKGEIVVLIFLLTCEKLSRPDTFLLSSLNTSILAYVSKMATCSILHNNAAHFFLAHSCPSTLPIHETSIKLIKHVGGKKINLTHMAVKKVLGYSSLTRSKRWRISVTAVWLGSDSFHFSGLRFLSFVRCSGANWHIL